jgi:anti-sigma factor RsiW
VNCAEAREALPTYIRDGQQLPTVRKHLAECEACREELALYERLFDSLEQLQSVTLEPPPELAPALVSIPRQSGGFTEALRGRTDVVVDHVARNRRAYIGGVGIAAIAGVAGAALWRSRGRRLAAA